MPQLGETVSEGTVGKWYRRVGEAVLLGDPLLDVETDKTSMEVPASAKGVLREIRAQVGDTVAVGSVIAVIADMDDPSEPNLPTPLATSGSTQLSDGSLSAPGGLALGGAGVAVCDPFHGVKTPSRNFGSAVLPNGVQVTPLARRLAAEAGLELQGVEGSGPGRRVVAADVRSRIASVHPAEVPASTVDDVASLYANVPHTVRLVEGMRKTIARRLTESKQRIPHFYVSGEINAGALVDLRSRLNTGARAHVTFNDLVIKAYALALADVPDANVVWADGRLLQFERVDLAVAVAVEGGLITPVLCDVAAKALLDISREMKGLVDRARNRTLQPQECSGGSGTLSNLGMYGVQSFQAILNPPHATILAVGAAMLRPAVGPDGGFTSAMQISASMSVDHRAVDGAVAGQLLSAFRRRMEDPLSLLI